MRKLFTFLAFTTFLSIPQLFSSNISGEIVFRQIDVLTVEAQVVIYWKSINLGQETARDSVNINWGDGSSMLISRVNGVDQNGNGVPDGELVSDQYSRHIYTGVHSYASAGTFLISSTIPNRVGGILNLNYPTSDNIPFHIQSQFTLDSGMGDNQSPILLEMPIDYGYVGHPFIHVVNAFDIDDDSISYQLIVPMQAVNMDVPQYMFPDLVSPGPDNNYFLNAITGVFYWDAPQMAGYYTFAIQINSYRDGVLQDQVIRDMLILIEDGENFFPEINLNTVTNEVQEVEVGDQIEVEVLSADDDVTQQITLTSSSGLYEYYTNDATFSELTIGNVSEGVFTWEVTQEHVRTQPYPVVFKSKDDYNGFGYANFKIIRYRVLGEVTSVSPDLERRSTISVFPTITDDLVTVEVLSDYSKSEWSYQVVDQNGKPFMGGKISNRTTDLSLSNLSAGMYFLVLQNGLEIQTFKLAKQ